MIKKTPFRQFISYSSHARPIPIPSNHLHYHRSNPPSHLVAIVLPSKIKFPSAKRLLLLLLPPMIVIHLSQNLLLLLRYQPAPMASSNLLTERQAVWSQELESRVVDSTTAGLPSCVSSSSSSALPPIRCC